MKLIGMIVAAISALCLALALNMSTTVTTPVQNLGGIKIPSLTVHNIGLMQDQKNYITASTVFLVIGVVLYLLGLKNDSNEQIENNILGSAPKREGLNNYAQQNLETENFAGEKTLSNDAYKLYLLDAYEIKKNDLLNKFVCKEKIFDTLDDAILFADDAEIKSRKVKIDIEVERIRVLEKREIAEKKFQADLAIKAEEERLAAKVKSIAQTKKITMIFLVISLITIFSLTYFNNSKRSAANETSPPSNTQSNQTSKASSNSKSDMGDSEQLENLIKNGSNGWRSAQPLYTGNSYSYLLLNPDIKNAFRYVKYINCLPDPARLIELGWDKFCQGHPNWYKKIVSDEIQPMRNIYKIIDEHETSSKYKDKSKITLEMNNIGWRNVKLYYLSGFCKDGGNASVKDFYDFSLVDGKIRRLTLCKEVVIQDVEMNPFEAEMEYYKSGMYQGD